MFLDKIVIRCKAGNGGSGAISFRKELYVPNGGPDGGDGGKGGSIIFEADNDMTNLSAFRFKTVYRAENGEDGKKTNRFGKDGANLVIKVPVGTIIKNNATGKVIADIASGDKITILKGGLGGRGNAKFATSTRQAPRFSETGVVTKEFELMLELKTIADVGLVGYPNVGKSSLLSRVTNAKPKIANYHFTTLAPNIGVVQYGGKSFVMADIPGLIEGASDGVGLGHDFLRHIERTRLLIHVIDISKSEGRDPYHDYVTINNELKRYGKIVANLPQIIALNKVDLLNDMSVVDDFKSKVKDKDIYLISAVAHIGLDSLMEAVIKKLNTLPKSEKQQIEETDIDKVDTRQYEVKKLGDSYYEVAGALITQIIRGVVLTDYTSNAYFQKRLKDEGIIDKLKNMGLKDGDRIKFGEGADSVELDWVE